MKLPAVIAWIVLLIFGGVLIPFQQHLDAQAKAAHFRMTPLTLNLREQIGQMGFLAALSGFRSPLAMFLWLDAHADFNTYEVTPSGNVHGMPVACLCGLGPSVLTELGGSRPAS